MKNFVQFLADTNNYVQFYIKYDICTFFYLQDIRQYKNDIDIMTNIYIYLSFLNF